MEDNSKLFGERLQRMETAIALGTPDRVPCAPFFYAYLLDATGSCFRDSLYNFDKAVDSNIKFYEQHPICDVHTSLGCFSGPANELADNQTIDWPGRPGGIVPDHSTYQVVEHEYMTQEEYPEMLNDFTGFMLRKYIPRAFPSLKGLSNIAFNDNIYLFINGMPQLYQEDTLKAYETLANIAKEEAKATAANGRYQQTLAEMGFPPIVTGMAQAPYDILGDYFRGTVGMFEDLVDEDMQDYLEKAIDMFADKTIESLQYFRVVDMPVKRVFFPLHKGVDGFMNDSQYEKLYWKPLKKVVLALIDMGVTPFLFAEGAYNSRLKYLSDVPKGKILYLFEDTDMVEAKKELGGTACIMGNLPISLLAFGEKDKVIYETRKLLDECMPGGGYIFSAGAEIDNAKDENVEAMLETVEKYGSY